MHEYAIQKPLRPVLIKESLAVLGAVAVAVAFHQITVALSGYDDFPIWPLAIFVAPFIWDFTQIKRRRSLLEIRPGGVQVRRRSVPWRSVGQIVIIAPNQGLGEKPTRVTVGVRLRPGAPLPDEVQATVHDPTKPAEIPDALRVRVPAGSLDTDAMLRAVRHFGLDDIPLVETDGSTERVLG